MTNATENATWQCVMVCWGDRYDVHYINTLVDAIRAKSAQAPRFCLITEAPKPGLDPAVRLCDFPAFFLQPQFRRGGCQAKLAMFEAGVLPDDLPAIYIDLDTVVFGDLSKGVALMPRRDAILMLQSAVIPFGPIGRLLARLTGGKRYARGNSSVVVFHPAECTHIAARFRDLSARHRPEEFRPMVADERFISWAAQPQMKALPGSFAVKFTSEYMFWWTPWLHLKAMLPWVRQRRARQVAVTLNDASIKPEALMQLPDGGRLRDRKGRWLIWSDRVMGPARRGIMEFYRRFQG